MIKLGAIMEDLECYIDNSLVFGEDGRIIARKGGIRRYIQSEIPDLYRSYKTLMRYKALAKKFRQAIGISDPIPASSVLPQEDEEGAGKSNAIEDRKDGAKSQKASERGTGEKNYGSVKNDENMVWTDSQQSGGDGLDEEIRRRVREILEVCEGTFLDFAAILALRICEDTIPHKSYSVSK